MLLKRSLIFLLFFSLTLTCNAATGLSAVLFSDDFNDNNIDPATWDWGGNRVAEEDGIMKVEQNTTDAGGDLYTKKISFNRTDLITITKDTKLHYANENCFPATRFNDVGNGAFWYISYNHHAYGNQYKFNIVRYDASGYHYLAETDPVWDTWFNEKIEYNPATGQLKYSINNVLRMEANVGAFTNDFSGQASMAFSGYGWYTGHYHYFDNFTVTQDQISQADINYGLVAYYPFNGNANDESGNGNHGTVSGATLTADRFGNQNSAYSFNGIDNFISIPEMLSPTIAACSISAWIMSNDVMTGGLAVYKGPMQGGDIMMGVQDGKIFLNVYFASGYIAQIWRDPVEPNTHYHVVGVYYRGDRVELWVNGELKGTIPVPLDDLRVEYFHYSSLGIYSRGMYINIGERIAWNGIIDEVRFYDRALSPDEILQLANASSTLLPPPSLTSPLDGASSTSPVPLRWSAVTGNAGYQLQIDSLAPMDMSSNQYDAALIEGTHTWKVRTKNAAGVPGPWSATWSFIVAPNPSLIPAPTLTNPAGGAVLSATPNLAWTQTGTVSHFQVQIATDAGFTNLAVNEPTWNSLTYSPPALSDGTYWWRVRAYYGGWSDWSTRTFTIGKSFPAPTLVSPPNGGEPFGPPFVFTWQPVPGAGAYQLKVSTDPSFAVTLINDQNIAGSATKYSTDLLLAGGVKHYWQMRTLDTTGTQWGPWSKVWTFTPGQAVSQSPVWMPLYRLYKSDTVSRDHFYTTNTSEKNSAVAGGYVYEGIEGYISAVSFSGSVPLYRLYQSSVNSHYYCTSFDEKSEKLSQGYIDEGVAGYVYLDAVPGLVAMHRFQQPTETPNHYVLCTRQAEYSFLKLTYIGDTIVGYIQPQGLKEPAAHARPQGNAAGVDLGSGAFRGLTSLDLMLKGRGPSLSFSHYYNSFNFHTYPNNYPLGYGWSHTLESAIIEDSSIEYSSGNVYVIWPDGTESAFTRTGPGSSDYRDESGAHDLLTLIDDGVNYGYNITRKDQSLYKYRRFTISPAPGQTIANFLQEGGQDNKICLISIEDWAGNRLSFNREASHATLLSVYDNFGRELRFSYNYPQFTLNQVDEVISGVTKRSIYFLYDNENLTAFIDAKGNITHYYYDADHQLTGVVDPEGKSMNVGYAAGKTVSVKQSIDRPTLITYEPAANITTVTDKSLNVFTYMHNEFKLALQQGQADLNPAKFVYGDLVNNPNLPTHVEDKEGNATDFEYDAMGNLTKITNADGKIAYFTYNAKNNLTSRTNFHAPGSTISPNYYIYDTATGNQLQSVITPENETTTIHYNSNHQVDWVQNPLGHTTSYHYDSYGNVSQITGPENNITQYHNDYAGRTYRVVDADLKGTNYTYDANDNLTSVKDHTQHEVSLYPTNNNNLSKVSWLNNGQLAETSYTYLFGYKLNGVTNPLGLSSYFLYSNNSQWSRVDFNGAQTGFYYDTNNRLKSINYLWSHTVTLARNNNGAVTSVSSPSGLSSFQYNTLNLVTSYTDPYGQVVQYDYDEAGRLWHLTYPGGKVVTYGYDRNGRLQTVQDWLGGTTTYIYDAAGNLKEIQRPNGTRAVYTYDKSSRLKTITEKTSGGSVICSYSHTLSAAGDILNTTMTEPLAGIPPIKATALTYDKANRLQSAGSTTFTYDKNGNRTGKTAAGQTTTFQWDYENLLTASTAPGKTVQHLYDGMNNRIARKVNGTETRFVLDVSGDLSQVLAETDASGAVQAYYVYGLGLVSRITPEATRQFYHYNHRGDTIALTDNAGNITDSYAYDPYGKLVASQGTTANHFKFVGRYGVMDEGDDLYFMRARFYDAGHGRFLSEDPLGIGGGDFNLYSYVQENPITDIDPEGTTANSTPMTSDYSMYINPLPISIEKKKNGKGYDVTISYDIVSIRFIPIVSISKSTNGTECLGIFGKSLCKDKYNNQYIQSDIDKTVIKKLPKNTKTILNPYTIKDLFGVKEAK